MSLSTFTWVPDWSPSGEESPRVLSVGFGDGYSQEIGDGINTNLPKWELKFSNRSKAEYDAILAFLRARNGVEQFIFTAPGESVAQHWLCKTWNPSPWNGGNNHSLTATFEARP